MSATGAELFARLAAEGSDALHRGDARAAAERLAAALRVHPDGDDVDVRADLAEAQLRLGRHRDVVPELRTLVARYPGRERLRRQLAVALARSGRRADALAVCSAEPGGPLLLRLQRAIERGERVGDDRGPDRPASMRARRAAFVAAAAAAAAGAGIGALAFDVGRRETGRQPRAPAPQPAAIRVPAMPVSRPSALPYAVDREALWSSRPDRRSVVLLGADGRTRRTVRVPGRVDALAAAHGSLWVADASAERLLRIAQHTGRVTVSVRLPQGAPGRRGAAAVDEAARTVWATGGGSLLRIDALTGRVDERIRIDGVTALVAEPGGAWVGTRTGDLVRVALRGSRTVVSRFPGVPGRVVRLLLAHGSLWVVRGDPRDADLWRYRTIRAAIFGTPVRGRFTADLAARPGAIWVRLPSSAYARIDAATSAVEYIERESPSAASPP